MKRALPLFAILLPAALAHADRPDASNTSDASETRNVSAFHAIDLAGTIGVEITLGKPASVQIVGEADQIGKVITTVKDGVLIVDTKPEPSKQSQSHSHLRAIVSAPDMSALTLSGTGAISVSGIANDSLTISLPGTGAINATGSTGTLHATLDGTGQLAAKDLAAKDVTISVNGTGSATLNATQSLEAKVSGTGSIDVHGHPARVKKSVSGVGNIKIR